MVLLYWCPRHQNLLLSHPALNAIKFSVSMNKSECSTSDHAVRRAGKLIVDALKSRKMILKPFSEFWSNICSIKHVRRAAGLFLFFILRFKAPCVWCQTAFSEVSIQILLRVNDSQLDLLGNWSGANHCVSNGLNADINRYSNQGCFIFLLNRSDMSATEPQILVDKIPSNTLKYMTRNYIWFILWQGFFQRTFFHISGEQ